MKKTMAFLMILALALGLAACGAPAQEAAAPQTVGGWEIAGETGSALPAEVQEAFDKAAADYEGGELTPVALVGQQVVAGMNYMILCKTASGTADAKPGYQMAVLYRDLQGNARITGVTDFVIGDYAGKEDPGPKAEPVAGGWSVPGDAPEAVLPEDAGNAFAKAAEKHLGNQLTPLAYLGSQLVSGRNYALLCRSTLVTAEPVSSVQLVIVYEDLQGNAKFTSICTLDPAEFNK